MRALKIIVKEDDAFQVHLLDLTKVRDIIFTYPREEAEAPGVEKDVESVVNDTIGRKIEFVYEENDSLEIDLEKNPAKFIVYDDYGNEIEKTDDFEELEVALLQTLSNDDPMDLDSDAPQFPPAA